MSTPNKPVNDGTPEHANDDVLYNHATWYGYGAADGEQGVPKKVLSYPFDAYQPDYDAGYAEGSSNRTFEYRDVSDLDDVDLG